MTTIDVDELGVRTVPGEKIVQPAPQVAIAEAVKTVAVPAQPLYRIPPKALIYGASGAGKSEGMLRLPGKKYVIDTEGGTLPYRNVFPFDGPNEPVDDLFVVHELVKKIMKNPYDRNLVSIDSMSPIWDNLQVMADDDKKRRSKGTDKSWSDFQNSLDRGSWTPLKRLWTKLIRDLRRTPLPIVITCRERLDDHGTPEPMAEKNLRYEFDVILRAEVERRGTEMYYSTYCERVRPFNPLLPTGATLPGRWSDHFAKAYAEWFTVIGTPVPRPSDTACEEFATLTLNYKPEIVKAGLFRRGVDRFEDLSPAVAEEVLSALRKVSQALQPTTQPQPMQGD